MLKDNLAIDDRLVSSNANQISHFSECVHTRLTLVLKYREEYQTCVVLRTNSISKRQA